jgi:hypothetical protein
LLEIQIPRGESFVETNLSQFHLFDAKEHRNIRARGDATVIIAQTRSRGVCDTEDRRRRR